MCCLIRKFTKAFIIILFLLTIIFSVEANENKNSFIKSILAIETDSSVSLNIATIAMECDVDPKINQLKMKDFVREIKHENPQTDLIFFGETISSRYHSKLNEYHKRIAETVPGPTTQLIAELAEKYNVYICFGIVEEINEKLYNSQVLIDNTGEIITVQRKKNLKSKAFNPGNKSITTVDIKGVKTGIVICADIRSKETLLASKEDETELILISNADWSDEWDNKSFAYRYLAKQYNSWIVTANRFGNEDEIFWDGHIEIVNPFGEIRMKGISKEQYMTYRLKINKSKTKIKLLNIYNKITIVCLVIKHLRIASHYI